MDTIANSLKVFFEEDGFGKNQFYFNNLPQKEVKCLLKIKTPMLLSGLPFLAETFNYLQTNCLDRSIFNEFEGKKRDVSQIEFNLPFNVALTGERIALNLLQRSSSISTFTNKFVEKAQDKNIKILDTRKTLPGLRFVDKYAVQVGGGHNHRFDQNDCFMIKDNHKKIWGGLKNALDFFKSMHSFYTPLIVEIHDLSELKQAIELNIKHVMLDNFSVEQIHDAIKIKPREMSYEVSGGITLESIESYLINGIDAISIGSLTYAAPAVDLSLKMELSE